MKKYAKILNDFTKECSVGLGTNEVFYQLLGMTQMDVEQASNGFWYLSGYADRQKSVNQNNNTEEI